MSARLKGLQANARSKLRSEVSNNTLSRSSSRSKNVKEVEQISLTTMEAKPTEYSQFKYLPTEQTPNMLI